jgi:hypothetical protein
VLKVGIANKKKKEVLTSRVHNMGQPPPHDYQND